MAVTQGSFTCYRHRPFRCYSTPASLRGARLLQARPAREQPVPAPQNRGGDLGYATFAIRVIRAHGRWIAEGDIEALPDLLDLADELHAATQHAVNGLRVFGYSWSDIASRLGTTR
jgi:hypothetical protein